MGRPDRVPPGGRPGPHIPTARALVLVAVAVASAAWGCAEDGGEAVVDCAGVLANEELSEPEDFVVDLRLTPFPDSGPVLGFDIDGTNEAICDVVDRNGERPGDRRGVDTNLGSNPVAGQLVERGFRESTTNILTLRLRRPSPTSVTTSPEAAACASFELGVSRAILGSFRRDPSDGSVFPNQRFRALIGRERPSLVARRERRLAPDRDVAVWDAASDVATLPFGIELEGETLPTIIENLRFRMIEGPTGATALLGGSVDPTPVVEQLADLESPPVDPALVRGILNTLTDIAPDPATGRCQRISLSAFGGLVPAEIVENTE